MRTILARVIAMSALLAGCSASLSERGPEPVPPVEEPRWVRQNHTLHVLGQWADHGVAAQWAAGAVVSNKTERSIYCGVASSTRPEDSPTALTSVASGSSTTFAVAPRSVVMCSLDWDLAARAVGMSGDELSRFYDNAAPIATPFAPSLNVYLARAESVAIDLNHRLFTSVSNP
jgi:hypothetical protein